MHCMDDNGVQWESAFLDVHRGAFLRVDRQDTDLERQDAHTLTLAES